MSDASVSIVSAVSDSDTNPRQHHASTPGAGARTALHLAEARARRARPQLPIGVAEVVARRVGVVRDPAEAVRQALLVLRAPDRVSWPHAGLIAGGRTSSCCVQRPIVVCVGVVKKREKTEKRSCVVMGAEGKDRNKARTRRARRGARCGPRPRRGGRGSGAMTHLAHRTTSSFVQNRAHSAGFISVPRSRAPSVTPFSRPSRKPSTLPWAPTRTSAVATPVRIACCCCTPLLVC
jgi:hypothetical protein